MPRLYDMLRDGNPDDSNKGKAGGAKKHAEGRPGEKPQSENHNLTSKKLLKAIKARGDDSSDSAAALYEKTITTISTLLEKISAKEDLNPFMGNVHDLLNDIFNQLILGDSILNMVYDKEDESRYYLPYHIGNVLILSSFLGIKTGLNKSRMHELGLAAIFCDAGMHLVSDIVNKSGRLSEDELELVRQHVAHSLKIASQVDKMPDSVKEAIKSHHERVDGSGYPGRSKSQDIGDYAKIIGLVDTYEAMTHDRAYRAAEGAHKTIKMLASSLKGNFDLQTMRLLLNTMSIYPIGTIVELDTGDIARVISVKPGSPLKPVVMVIQDYYGNPPKEKTIIDLAAADSISIINSI